MINTVMAATKGMHASLPSLAGAAKLRSTENSCFGEIVLVHVDPGSGAFFTPGSIFWVTSDNFFGQKVL
jgi:hypothetical protein